MSHRGLYHRGFLSSTLAVALCAVMLAGCADAAAERIGEEVRKELRLHEADGSSMVDFDQLVHGEWSQLILVCDDVDNDDLNAALGFEWAQAPNLDAPNYAQLFVFSTGTQVEVSYSPEVDDSLEERYFWPCPPASEERWAGGPIVVDRAHSKIRFHFVNAGGGYEPVWYVPWDELQRLSKLR